MYIGRHELQAIDFGGLKIYDYTANLTNNKSSFAIIDIPVLCNHNPAFSKHSDKYYYVISGEVCFTVEGNKYLLTEGDFFLVEKGKIFSYANNSDNAARLVLVHTPSFSLDDEIFV